MCRQMNGVWLLILLTSTRSVGTYKYIDRDHKDEITEKKLPRKNYLEEDYERIRKNQTKNRKGDNSRGERNLAC